MSLSLTEPTEQIVDTFSARDLQKIDRELILDSEESFLFEYEGSEDGQAEGGRKSRFIFN